jgi:hypothetical protein
MKKFNCTIKIEAESAKEADQTLKALTTIASKLPPSVLTQLADVVGNPIKLAYAKQQLGIS